jgi:hypothetical protein
VPYMLVEDPQADTGPRRVGQAHLYCAVSCSRISAMRDSRLSALIVATGDPLGRAHQMVWLGQQRTTHRSQRGYLGRSIASCSSAQSFTRPCYQSSRSFHSSYS